jgi:hypothetical protein
LAALVPDDARTAPEFALHYGVALLTVSFAALWCWRFARNNYLAYALVFWVMEMKGDISSLLETAIPAMRIQGWVLVGLVIAGAIWVALPAVFRRGDTETRSLARGV